MAKGILNNQKSGVQSVDNIKPDVGGNIDLQALKTTGGNMTGNIGMGGNAITNVKNPVAGTDAANLDTTKKEAKKIANESWTTQQVTLQSSNWSGNTQRVSVSGVTATNDVVVSPDADSYDVYHASTVRMTKQEEGFVTFKWGEEKPGSNLTVNLLIRTVFA